MRKFDKKSYEIERDVADAANDPDASKLNELAAGVTGAFFRAVDDLVPGATAALFDLLFGID